MKKIALILSVVLAVSPMSILAASTAECTDTDLQKGIITVEGKMDGTQVNGMVSVEVKNSSGEIVFAGVYNTTDSDGNYIAQIGMKKDTPVGDYTIKVSSYQSNAPEFTVSYINPDDVEDLLDAFNKSSDVSSMRINAIEKYSGVVNIRDGIYKFLENEDKDAIAQHMLDVRPDGGYDATTVNQIKTDIADKMKVVAFDRAKTGEQVKLCFDAYDDYGATDLKPYLYNEFTQLTDKDKDFAYNVMAEYKYAQDGTNDGVFNAINHAVILNKIYKASSPDQITKIISDNRNILPEDMISIFDACNKTQLELYINGIEELSTMSKLKKAISDAYAAQTAPGAPNPYPGNTSSGGGGGSFGGSGSFPGNDKLPPIENGQNNAPTQTAVFTDIGNVEWAQQAILYLNDKKIISGDGNGKFRPNDNITREEFTKIVVVAFGIPSSEQSAGFVDVADDNWAKDYINAAYKSGIVKGISDSEFGFGTNISRQDMALMVLRAAEKSGMTFEAGEITTIDADSVADYAKDSVGKMMKAGIINGFADNTFLPEANATRAQAAKIIYALIEGTEVK